MQRPWMAIVLAAALNVSAGAALAAAQTVTVINAPPNSNIDVVLNEKPVASGAADAAGAATLKTMGPAARRFAKPVTLSFDWE